MNFIVYAIYEGQVPVNCVTRSSSVPPIQSAAKKAVQTALIIATCATPQAALRRRLDWIREHVPDHPSMRRAYAHERVPPPSAKVRRRRARFV